MGPAQRQALHQARFTINLRDRTITCPAGNTERFIARDGSA
jgi:hypothetical protein